MTQRFGERPRHLLSPILYPLLLLLLAPAAALAQPSAPLLTPEEAVETALAENPALRVARNAVEIAENDYAYGNAGFFPRLSLSAGQNGTLSNTRQVFIENREVENSGARTDRYDAGVSLNWTVFEGGARTAAYRRLGAERDRQAVQAVELAEATLADVLVQYFDIVRQKQQVRVFEEAVAISRERLRIAELRRDLGSASELEVRQALVDLNSDSAGVIRQTTLLENARATLNRLMGRSPIVPFAVIDEIVVDTTLGEQTLRRAAMAENPTLAFARADRRVAELQLREVRAERFPTIDFALGGGYQFLDAESGFLLSNRTYDFTFGVTASYDLFDGFDRRRRRQNAQVEITNAGLLIEDAERQVEAALASVYRSYRSSLALVALERTNLEAVRLNVEIALERFRLGTISSVELREVQEDLIEAESRLIQALFEAKQAEVALRELTGRLAP